MPDFQEKRLQLPDWPLVAIPLAAVITFGFGLFGGLAWMLLVKAIAAAAGSHVSLKDPVALLGATVAQDAGFVLGPIIALLLRSQRLKAGDFGFTNVSHKGKTVLVALGAWVAFVAFSAAWSKLVHIHEHQSITKDLGVNDSPLLWTTGAFMITVIAPLCEEFMFRGFLFPLLWKKWGLVAGIVVSSVLFGLLHASGTPVALLVPLAVLAVVLCLLRAWSGSLLPGIALHSFNNAIAFGTIQKLPAQSILLLAAIGIAACMAISVIIVRRA